MKTKELVILKKTEVANDGPIKDRFAKLTRIQGMWEEDIRNATGHAVQWGAEALELKMELGHGKFMAGLAEYCPEVSERTSEVRMQVAKKVISLAAGVKSFKETAACCGFGNMPISNLLEMPKDELTPEQANFQNNVSEVIKGKSIRDLLKQFAEETAPAHRGGDNTPRDPVTNKRIQAPRSASKSLDPEFATQVITDLEQDITSVWEVHPQYLAACSDEAFKALDRARVELGKVMAKIRKS